MVRLGRLMACPTAKHVPRTLHRISTSEAWGAKVYRGTHHIAYLSWWLTRTKPADKERGIEFERVGLCC